MRWTRSLRQTNAGDADGEGLIRPHISERRPLSEAPQALATVKRLVLGCATQDDRAVLDDAAKGLVGLLRRPQTADGIKAFMAKTPPPWAKD